MSLSVVGIRFVCGLAVTAIGGDLPGACDTVNVRCGLSLAFSPFRLCPRRDYGRFAEAGATVNGCCCRAAARASGDFPGACDTVNVRCSLSLTLQLDRCCRISTSGFVFNLAAARAFGDLPGACDMANVCCGLSLVFSPFRICHGRFAEAGATVSDCCCRISTSGLSSTWQRRGSR